MIVNSVKAARAAEILGVELTALTADGVNAAYRDKAKALHPDVGDYDPAAWADLSWAKECLLFWVKRAPCAVDEAKPDDCRACGGKGRVELSKKGFGKATTVMCIMCNGSGAKPTGGNGAMFNRGE